MIYDFNIIGDKLNIASTTGAMTGSMNYYKCKFSFCEDWSELQKFAVFMGENKVYTILIENEECFIPTELLNVKGTIKVGVYGISESGELPIRISTDFAHIIIEEGAYRSGTCPHTPSPDLWEEYFRMLTQKSADAANEAINASLGDICAAIDGIIKGQEAIISIQNKLIGGDTV